MKKRCQLGLVILETGIELKVSSYVSLGVAYLI